MMLVCFIVPMYPAVDCDVVLRVASQIPLGHPVPQVLASSPCSEQKHGCAMPGGPD